MMNYSTTGLRLVVVYRLPPSQEHKINVALFLNEFATFLEMLASTNGPLLLTGYFNFHLDVPTDRAAIRFMGLIEAFNLIQHVSASTHKNGHTLDLMITKANDNFIKYKCLIQLYPTILRCIAGCLSRNQVLKGGK